MDNLKIFSVTINKPIFSSGLQDPSWLFPNIKRENKIVFFNFAANNNEAGVKEGSSKEGNIGRLSRAIPLYIMERLFIETNSEPAVNIIFAENIGPVLAGARNEGKNLNEQLKNKYDFIVTGLITRNISESKITIQIFLYEIKSDTENMFIEYIASNNETLEQASFNAANLFLEKIRTILNYKNNDQSFIDYYKRPKENIGAVYLLGSAQLLTQTFAHNKFTSPKELFGENNMLNWYKYLMESDINNNCAKLMYLKGIIASIDYGGSAYINHIDSFKRYILMLKDINLSDPIVKLSPLFFKKINDKMSFKTMYEILKKQEDKEYIKWLAKIDKMPFNKLNHNSFFGDLKQTIISKFNSNKDISEKSSDEKSKLDILYILTNETYKKPEIAPLFYKELLNSEIYALTINDTPKTNLEKDNGISSENQTISLKGFQDQTIPIFSSEARMFDNASPLKPGIDTYIVMKGIDLFRTCQGVKFILNPYSDSAKELLPEEINAILNGPDIVHKEIKIEENTEVLVKEPEEKSQDMIESIRNYCKTNPNINSAYLALVIWKKTSEKSLTIGIDASPIKDREELKKIFDDLYNAIRPYLNENEFVDFVDANKFDSIRIVKPIYMK